MSTKFLGVGAFRDGGVSYIVIFFGDEVVGVSRIAKVHGDVHSWCDCAVWSDEVVGVDGSGCHPHVGESFVESIAGQNEV